MRNFFEPAVGPPWLKQVLTSIRTALKDIWDHPILLWRSATADLPTASTDNEGGIVYDSTLDRVAVSNGSAWVTLAPYDASIASIAALAIVQGDLIYGSASETFSRLAKDTNATRYLANTGTSNNPAWAQVNLSNGVTGTLPVANGGTNASSASGTALDNITGFSSTGHLVRTGSGAYAFRTITGTTNQITVTNGSGVSANPTLSLPTTVKNADSTYSGSTEYFATRGDANDRLRLGHYDSSTVSFPTGQVPAQILAGVTRLDISSRDNASGVIVFRAGSGVNEIGEFNSGGLDLRSGKTLEVNSVQVVTARQTGWGAATGTATRTAIATYTAPTISNPPTQAEVQAIADALQAWSRRSKALSDDMATHGLIGA